MVLVLKGILLGLVYFLIGYFNRKNSKKGKLFFGKWILFLGAGCLMMAILPFYAIYNGLIQDKLSEYVASVLLVISFASFSLTCLLEYRITYGEYNKDYISFCTPWSGCKRYEWSERDYI